MADPVAAKSTFLCMYMSNHPDTLVAYVKYFGKIKEKVSSAKMTAIDKNAMTLSYTIGGGKDEKTVKIAFDPPLLGYEEVKPRLLGMTADAQESLGMTKAPQIKDFTIDLGVLRTGIPLACLVYTTLSPLYHGPFWSLGHFAYNAFGSTGIKLICYVCIAVHVSEGIYAQRLAVKHRMPFDVAFKYVTSVLIFGFTVLLPLRKKIQTARIDSIMKGN